MDLTAIAAKQKRLRDWSEFLETKGLPERLRQRVSTTLELYRKVLFECWESKQISPDSAFKIADLERTLEDLNEEIRLQVPVTQSRQFEK